MGNLASRWKRLGGAIIDAIVMMIIVLPVMFFTGMLQSMMAGGGNAGFGAQAMNMIIGWVAFMLVNGYFLVTKGQTVGKMVLGMKIVDMSGQLPGPANIIFLRYIALWIVELVPVLGGILGLVDALFIFSGAKRCLHDRIAGTQVVDA